MIRTANDPAIGTIVVTSRRDSAPSRRPRRGRHRRQPNLLARACGVLALCGATAGAATAVVAWSASPLPSMEMPVVFTEFGPVGGSTLDVLERAADAVRGVVGTGEEPATGLAVPAAPDRTDPGGTGPDEPAR